MLRLCSFQCGLDVLVGKLRTSRGGGEGVDVRKVFEDDENLRITGHVIVARRSYKTTSNALYA